MTGASTRKYSGASNYVGSPVCVATMSTATAERLIRATFFAASARGFHRTSRFIRASFPNCDCNTITTTGTYLAMITPSGYRWSSCSAHMAHTNFNTPILRINRNDYENLFAECFNFDGFDNTSAREVER